MVCGYWLLVAMVSASQRGSYLIVSTALGAGGRLERERKRRRMVEGKQSVDMFIIAPIVSWVSELGRSEADWVRYNMRLPLWALRDATATLCRPLWL